MIMANIGGIITAVCTALKTITTENGRTYDIGSVSPTDAAFRDEFKTFPSADVTWDDDGPDEDVGNSLLGFSQVMLTIRLKWSLDPVDGLDPTDPQFDADTALGTLMGDVRDVLSQENGTLILPPCAVLIYKGTRKVLSVNGDLFRPVAIESKWLCKYQQLATLAPPEPTP